MADRIHDMFHSSPTQVARQAGGHDQALLAQMIESNSAYDLMTLKVEQTAADIRELASKREFKCRSELAAANQRAVAAECELATLRAALGVHSGGAVAHTGLPFPILQSAQQGASGCQAGPLQGALHKSQDEPDCLGIKRAELSVHILKQASDIRLLQQSLERAQEQASNVHSMCSTAYCNHIRSIVGRIERAVLPVHSLMEVLQPLLGTQLQSAGVERVDTALNALLESKEWSSKDWERVECASVNWLDRLHSILSSCAHSLQTMSKDCNKAKRNGLDEAAASELARQVETACSHLHEIHQQQVVSMREAAEAAQRIAKAEQELQQQRKEAADATAARDALQQAHQEAIQNLHVAELRAREAEASCNDLCIQMQLLSSGQRAAASGQLHDVTATDIAVHQLGGTETAAARIAEDSAAISSKEADSGMLRDTAQLNDSKARIGSPESAVDGPEAAAILRLPSAVASQCLDTTDQTLNAAQGGAHLSDQAAPKHLDIECPEVGAPGGLNGARNGGAVDSAESAAPLPRAQSLQVEAQTLHEQAKEHASTEESVMAAVHTALRRLVSAADSVQNRLTHETCMTGSTHTDAQTSEPSTQVADASSAQECIQEVKQAAAVCSAALQRAAEARQAHNSALSRANAVDRAALTANSSELVLECSLAVQRAERAASEKQALEDKLCETQSTLECTESMLLELQMSLRLSQEQCEQHRSAAQRSSELSDTAQKLLLVAEARASEAETQVAHYKDSMSTRTPHDHATDTSGVHMQADRASDGTAQLPAAAAADAATASTSEVPAATSSGADAGSRWHNAVSRVVNLVATSSHGAKSLPQDAIVAVEELQAHIIHAENFRGLAEDVIVRQLDFGLADPTEVLFALLLHIWSDVQPDNTAVTREHCCSAKERILAHSKEQQLDIPVILTERNSVAIEDVASMLDRVLITSSNNADAVCDLQEELAVVKSDAASLREEAASWQARSEASDTQAAASSAALELQILQRELEMIKQELENSKEQLKSSKQELERARQDTAAASAQLLTTTQMHEEHVTASVHAQEELMQQIQQLQQSLVLSDARAEGLSIDLSLLQDKLMVKESDSALEARKDADAEIRRLHTDLKEAEEREDGLLKQVETLEQTVQELSAALDDFQNEEPREDAAAVDPGLQDKLHAVDQQVAQLAAQLSEAQTSVKYSEAATQEERHKAERLEQELRDARITIAQLEAAVAASRHQDVENRSMVPNSGLEGNRNGEAGEGSRSPIDARDTPDAQESPRLSQEGTDRTYSPTSDLQSESSLYEELRQALDRTSAAESKVAVLQTESDEKQALIMQLMDDVGTLQSQLDEMQLQRIREDDGFGSRFGEQQDEVAQLRAEIKELQSTVESANKDLQTAETHANAMQESLQEHEQNKVKLTEELTKKLLTLQQAQDTLESDFREMRSERDQALADLQLLAEHCGNLLEEQTGGSEELNAKWLQRGASSILQKMAGSADLHETVLIKAERH